MLWSSALPSARLAFVSDLVPQVDLFWNRRYLSDNEKLASNSSSDNLDPWSLLAETSRWIICAGFKDASETFSKTVGIFGDGHWKGFLEAQCLGYKEDEAGEARREKGLSPIHPLESSGGPRPKKGILREAQCFQTGI